MKIDEEERKDELAPMELLAALFGDDEENDEEEIAIEEEDEEELFIRLLKERSKSSEKPKEPDNQPKQPVPTPAALKGVITVNDLVEAEDVYGPAMPPQEFLASEFVVETNANGRTELITIDDKSSSGEEGRRKKKSKKKEKKKHKKKEKSKRKKRRSRSYSE